MRRTRVGYAGGKKDRPTYRSMGDHTETIEILFDPETISYADLLEEFFAGHNPVSPAYSRQYRSVILVRDEGQRKAAAAALAAAGERTGRPLATRIEPLSRFWVAEDDHQKYVLRQKGALMRVMKAHFPEEAGFRDAAVAARLNAYAGRDLTRAALRRSLGRLDLAPALRADLEELVGTLPKTSVGAVGCGK